MHSRVVTVLSNSGTGTQDITFTGGTSFTPKVAIVQYSYAAKAAGFNEGVSLGYGFTDGTNSRCVAYVSEDATAASDTARIQSNNSLISALNQTGTITTVDAVATFTSWIPNGMQITWTNAPTAPFYIQVTFLGGSDLTNVQVGTLMTTTGASCSVTGMAWQPDFGMFLHSNFATENSGSSTTPSLSIGAAKDSSNQWNQTWSHVDASATSAAQMSFSHGRVVVQRTTTLTAYSVFSSWNAGGFTLNNTDTYAVSHPIYYLVTKGGSIKVGNNTEPAGTGNQTITTSTDVKSVMILGADLPTADTIAASGMFSTGMGDSTGTQASITQDELPASDPMANTSYYSTSYIYNNITANATAASSTVDDQASLGSVSGTGFVLNWNNIGQARTFRYITFGGVFAETYPVTINETAVSVSESLDDIESYHKTISEPSVSIPGESLDSTEGYVKPISESAVSASDSIEGTKIPAAPTNKTFDVHFVEFPEEVFDSVYAPPPFQLTHVTADKTHKYSVIQQITKTKTHVYNVLQQITQTKTHKYNVLSLTQVTQTKTHKFTILLLVSPPLTRTHKYHVLNSVSTTKTHKFSLVTQVILSKTHKFNLVNKIVTTKTHKYTVIGLVTKTRTHKYNVIGLVTKTKTHLYNVIGLIARTRTHKYNIIQQITQIKTHKYNVTGKITTLKTHVFSVLNSLSQTKTHKYNIIIQVIQTRIHKYNVSSYLVRVTTTKTHKYDVDSPFIQISPLPTKTHKFAVLEKVTKLKTHVFSVLAQVPTTKTHKFSVIRQIIQAKTHKFSVIIATLSVKTHIYDVIQRIDTTKTHKYNVLALVTRSKTHKYHTEGIVTTTKTHKFDIEAIVGTPTTTKTHKFSVIQQTGQTKTHIYNILEQIGSDKTHKYNIGGLVTQPKTHKFSIIQRITVIRTHKYHVANRVTPDLTKTHVFSIHVLVSRTRTHKFNLVGRLTTTKTHRYGVGGGVSTTKTHRFEVGLGVALKELGGSTNAFVRFQDRVRIIDIISDLNNKAIANIEIQIARPPTNIAIGVVAIAEYVPGSKLLTASAHYRPRHRVASTLIIPQVIDTIDNLAIAPYIGIEELPLSQHKQFQTRSHISIHQKYSRIHVASQTQLSQNDKTKIRIAAATMLQQTEQTVIGSKAQLEIPTKPSPVLAPEIMSRQKAKILRTLINLLSNNALFE